MPEPIVRHRAVTRSIMAAAILATVFLVYSGVYTAPFVFDDYSDIVTNESIKKPWPPGRMMFAKPPSGTAGRPVANVSLALNHALTGLKPLAYHLFDVSFHAASALLLFALVAHLLGGLEKARPETARPWLQEPEIPAFFAAISWSAHPLATSAVSLAFHRPETLCAFFCLATVFLSVKGFGSPRPRPWHIAASASFLLAVGSKETAVAAPFMVLALWMVLFQEKGLSAFFRQYRTLAVGFAAGLAALALLVAASGAWGRASAKSEFTVFQYAVSQGLVIFRYLRLFLVPTGLCADRADLLPPLSISLPAAVMVGAGALAALAALVKRRPLALVPAWFFLFLAPSSSLAPLNRLSAEHRMLLPLMALSLALVLGTRRLFSAIFRKPGSSAAMILTILALSAWTAFLAVGSHQRNRVYESNVSFWKDTTEKSPGNTSAWVGLGAALAMEKRPGEAEAAYLRALKLNPRLGSAHNNLGALYLETGNLPKAEFHYVRLLAIDPKNPHALNGIGRVLAENGRFDEALGALSAAVGLLPENASMRFNLADTLFRAGRQEEALEAFRQTLSLDPGHEKANVFYGAALIAAGQKREALAFHQEALARFPENPQMAFNTGRAFLEADLPEKAEPHFKRAAGLLPGSADAEDFWGMSLGLSGRSESALLHHRRALAIDPNHLSARVHLAVVLAETGRADEALKELAPALQKNPEDAALKEIMESIQKKLKKDSSLTEAGSGNVKR
ncbi:MAG: tetratricopeptide repeat protein [Deltaproteobacteria bacterium]|nr:tetratricopeptide repeat protein [Deltaproteobacteria bacterium]